MNQNNDQITKLEEEIAHLSMSNDEMSAEIVSQWKRIEDLERKMLKLENRLLSMEESFDNPIEVTKPPHW